MDGWMNECMDGWINGVDGWMDGRMNGRIDGMDGRKNRWRDERDEWKGGSIKR